ncbi:hypothetical protein [Pantoea cypripedii]|uniref:HrpE/YscL family type III secretion apparatus protein n=1 Tax=Pantoea cypripedii TaxID=55209 RepID=A0A6B9GEX6_PANCY|nr:hypothetical protein [Pantoea cypripedii]QGY32129.1 hypothetical protein CUN67_24360 [Pantoea cypripedii]
MSRLRIKVESLPLSAPAGLLIRANELAQYQEAQDIIQQAHEQAARIKQEADDLLCRIQQQRDEACEAAREEGLVQLKEEEANWRQQAVAETVQWLLDEHELECNVIRRLEPRLRSMMTQVFKQFYQQQDGSRLLMDRLRSAIDSLLTEDSATLHVCPAQWDTLQHAFAAWPGLKVKSNPELTIGQATLSSPMVTLQLDLEEQLNAMLSCLNKDETEVDDDYQD